MAQVLDERTTVGEKRERTITVTVNRRPVTFEARRATGAEIKAEAIRQGVPIQQNFMLFLVRGKGNLAPVADEEQIVLHRNQEFRAVAPDDTSWVHR